MDGENPTEIDFYTISEKWTNERNLYPDKAQSDPVDRAKHLYYKYISNK